MALATAVTLQLAALVCVVVAYVKRDDASIEGAYFNRATGEDVGVASFAGDVRPWLIAAAVLIVASAAMWLLTLHARPPRRRSLRGIRRAG